MRGRRMTSSRPATRPPGVIQNASIAYALKMATFGPFFAWGASGDLWPAIIAALSFGLGLCLVYILRRPLLAFLDNALGRDQSITVHEFLARQYGNDPRVRLLAAGLTIFALAGLILAESIALAAVLKPVLPAATAQMSGRRHAGDRSAVHGPFRQFGHHARGPDAAWSDLPRPVRCRRVPAVPADLHARADAAARHPRRAVCGTVLPGSSSATAVRATSTPARSRAPARGTRACSGGSRKFSTCSFPSSPFWRSFLPSCSCQPRGPTPPCAIASLALQARSTRSR